MDPVEPVDDVLGRVAELAQGQLIMMAAPGQCEEETVEGLLQRVIPPKLVHDTVVEGGVRVDVTPPATPAQRPEVDHEVGDDGLGRRVHKVARQVGPGDGVRGRGRRGGWHVFCVRLQLDCLCVAWRAAGARA